MMAIILTEDFETGFEGGFRRDYVTPLSARAVSRFPSRGR
jgi:hypothetical protein